MMIKHALPPLEKMDSEDIIQHLNDAMLPDEGKIPTYIMGSPSIHQLEKEKIFTKTWLFLGHESELPNNGDFITRDLAGYSIILNKDKNGTIRAFYNMCTHRGMKLCRADKGNKTHFTCPYHGFTFDNTGELKGVPLQKDIYGDALDKSTMALHEATIDSYQGCIFGTWNPEPEPLSDYLGDFKWYWDLLFGRAEMEAAGPPQRYVINADWKIGSDNFVGDSYHTMVTHGSIVKLGMVPSSKYSKKGYQLHTPHGHGCNIGMPNPDFAFEEHLVPEFKRNLSDEQFDVLSNIKNINGTLFPNLSFLISHTEIKGKLISNTSVRLWNPIGHDKMEVITWFFVEKEASADWKERSRESFILTFSPSGIFEQDDTEVFTDITNVGRGLVPQQKALHYTLKMGMNRTPTTNFPGPGTVYDDKFTEANQRNFYKYWLELMNS
ncbi:aromatic ring-hydroxylating oxygenase subunit alpha [Alteribacillus bidgolensis]|uniref:Phenylpropionate dioxygenase, large terminal subunit n=1 Tax=Alteribacillus bidgolensis TaxID=930129 RepID=A0A1G8FQM7_9BACI|nr:aromatic ring-hydroxylating dioxygenase subunit alpha [Alteribacillus bidgolensis]SDH84415.1 Phenylpropionate dioxygenase, large terminal subunit [Alteribacillus bidgolensis]